jgi:hypothetical protein
MAEVFIRFHAELIDLILPRDGELSHRIQGSPAAFDVIESLGVPHTEIGEILINGKPAPLSRRLQDGDRVDVHPFRFVLEESVTEEGVSAIEPELRFVLDVHLGRLASYLRMLGFDTLYRNDLDDPEIERIAKSEHRIVLTRDRQILKRSGIGIGCLIRSADSKEQLAQVAKRYPLASRAKSFTRCLRCNGKIRSVPKENILELLEPLTVKYYNEFFQCESCERVYWKGSHYDRMMRIIGELRL